MSTARIVWEQTRASGRRTSWAKWFTDLALSKGAKAFIGGEYLKDGVETDLEIGTLVVEVVPTGSVKNGSNEARIYRVSADGLERTGVEVDYNTRWLTLKDEVIRLMAEETLAEKDNPLAEFSVDDLLAELRRRNAI